MKIEAITLRELQIPLVHFFETSFGRTYNRRVLLVTLHCDGLEGWGECVAGEEPYYSEEYIDGAWDVIVRYLGPSLLGRTLKAGSEVPALLGQGARAPHGQGARWRTRRGMPRRRRRASRCGSCWAARSAKSLAASASAFRTRTSNCCRRSKPKLAAGYQRIKLKVKPGWDVDVLEKVRARWPDILLSCDANSAYTLNDLEHLKTFDRFKLLMIEQPLWSDDFYFHARLQKRLQTAICLDEAIRSSRDAEAALELGACRIINIKVGRIGGFTDAIAVHDVAQRFGVPVWCGGMLESGMGRSHNVALSTLPNFKLPGDVSASKRYWKEDIIEPEVEVSPQGTIAITDKPGRGYDLRPDLIES